MELKVLEKLVKIINPKTVNTNEYNEVTETKTGKDWIASFISARKQISDSDAQILIEHFSKPLKESQTKNLKTKI